MKKPELRRTDLMTFQEQVIIGGTPRFIDEHQWYTPEGFWSRKLNLIQARELRKELRFAEIPASILKLLGERTDIEGLNLKLKLADLGKTGDTVSDPVIVEFANRVVRGKTVQRPIERKDLTNEFYAMFQEQGIDFHLRGPRLSKEGMFPSSEQKG